MNRLKWAAIALTVAFWVWLIWEFGLIVLAGGGLTLILGGGMAYRRMRAEREETQREERLRDAIERSKRNERR